MLTAPSSTCTLSVPGLSTALSLPRKSTVPPAFPLANEPYQPPQNLLATVWGGPDPPLSSARQPSETHTCSFGPSVTLSPSSRSPGAATWPRGPRSDHSPALCGPHKSWAPAQLLAHSQTPGRASCHPHRLSCLGGTSSCPRVPALHLPGICARPRPETSAPFAHRAGSRPPAVLTGPPGSASPPPREPEPGQVTPVSALRTRMTLTPSE